ncbi:MAG TPA: DCC1-like thiol-disulfide oxidoreductase family protein [Mucilaginibacter sp.]|nr:DCC1-like thiol-disulfide oxidoreductase family protein [Mucilaginibacter sp.]
MKTLKNHLILFDGECPMCRAYTHAFVKTGMLDSDGRAAYQEELAHICPVIDRQRAVNEIALINLSSGEVTYGVTSIFKILGNAWPLLAPILAFKPFLMLMRQVYAFISYNRRVIIPGSAEESSFSYQPTFRIGYRITYLLFTWFLTGCILTMYAGLLNPLIPVGNPTREYLICGGQIIFQGCIISIFNNKKRWDYLGNMMTISFAGSLLLLLPLLISQWFYLPPVFCAGYFLGVAGLMALEHIRRSKLMKLGWIMTCTWVLYRLVLLGLIVN